MTPHCSINLTKGNKMASRYGFEWVISCKNHKDFFHLHQIAEKKFGFHMILPLSYFAKTNNYYGDGSKCKFALQFNTNRKHDIDDPDKIYFKTREDMETILSAFNSNESK